MAKEEKGKTFSFQVQGYYEGRVRVESTACGMDKAIQYKDSALLTFSVKVTRDCLFAITITPIYPPQPHQEIVVWPIIGFVAVKALDKGEAWAGTTRKTSNWSATNNWMVKSGDTQPVRVQLNGCGNYDKQITPVNGVLTMNLKDAWTGWAQDICVLDGVAISPVFQNLFLNVLGTGYNPRFYPLPLPKITYDDENRIWITADPAVSLISLDRQYEFSTHAAFWFDSTKPHILRLLTVKGRTVFGTYHPSGRKWTWAQ